jgi:hypothetical protein
MKLSPALAHGALLAALLAGPAAACEFDGMPGFMGHSYRTWMTDEEAAIARQEAMAEARKAFLANHSLTPDSPPPADEPVAEAPRPAAEPPETSLR